MQIPAVLIFALSDPGFSTRLVSPPSQIKAIQLHVDSFRPRPSVSGSRLVCSALCRIAAPMREASLSLAMPCPIVSRRVPSLRCRLVSAHENHLKASPLHCVSICSFPRLAPPFPCFSQLIIAFSALIRLRASDHRVTSRRPAFPQLRRSAPIPSLPWLIHSMLFLAMRFRRPAGRFQAVLFLCHSWAGLTVPCRNTSAHVQSLQCLVPSHRVASVKLRAITARAVSWCLAAIPYQRIVVLFPSWPLASVSIRFVTSAIVAMPCQLIAVGCPSWLRTCSPSRIICYPVPASPFLFLAPAFAAIPLRCRSDQSLARQFSAFASLFWSLPCHFVSTHLRFCRSWPFLCCSLPVRAEPCPFLSIPLGSIPFRVRSDPYASARLGSVSARFRSCPSLSIPCRLRSTRIDATPSQLHAVLVAAGQRGSVSIRLKSDQG